MTSFKRILFSHKFSAGSRIYIFEVKESVDKTKYLMIKESKNGSKNIHKLNQIMIFKEYVVDFHAGLRKAIRFMRKQKDKTYNMEEIHIKYPNAYAKWTKIDDKRLINFYMKNNNIEKMAMIFKRKPSAIHSRLKKLNKFYYQI